MPFMRREDEEVNVECWEALRAILYGMLAGLAIIVLMLVALV